MPWITVNGAHVLIGEPGEGGGAGGAGERSAGGKSGFWQKTYPEAGGGTNVASTNQAIEIIKMQSMGAPPAHIEQYLSDNGVDYVDAYHASSIEGAKRIEEDGIKVSYQENRPDASYFFLDKADIGRNANNLGLGHNGSEYAVVTVRIPRGDAANISDDGLYNGTFSKSYSAARLFRSIPASWIKNIKTQK